MAHARLSGIFRVGEIDPATISADGIDLSVLSEPGERELIAALLDFPSVVASAADAREPQRMASSLLETADLVHKWYHKYRVLEAPPGVRAARLVLARAAQIVLRNGLTILGISAPERM
jgi:arginyl-tRNA synthetase